MKISLESVQRIMANYALHYPEAGHNGESLIALSKDYFDDMCSENVSDKDFVLAARGARKVCRFFPKIADILAEVAKVKESNPPGHDWEPLVDLEALAAEKQKLKEARCIQTRH